MTAGTSVLQPASDAHFSGFFKTIYRYREYLKQSVIRDLRKRYKRSVLGYFWSMLHPLMMMAILSLVFSNIMKSSVKDYAVFLFAAMLPWKFFASTATESLNSISGNVSLLYQMPLPKYLFPLSYAFSNLIDLLLTLIPLFAVMIFFGRSFPPTMLLLPVVLLPLFFLTSAVSFIFAVSNVFFRDTQHLSTVILQGVYFMCPVIYGRHQLPDWLVKWLELNPLFGIIEMCRSIIYDGRIPDPAVYIYCLSSSALLLIFSLWLFKRADQKFIYFV